MKTKRHQSTFIAAVFLCSLLADSAGAQDTISEAKPAAPGNAAPDTQTVSISAVKDPEMKSYRAMLAGLDAFEKHHALAPQAPQLRFVLSSMSDESRVDFAHTKLSIRGDNVIIPVVLDAGNGFVLPRDQQAESENADLILDVRKGKIRGRPEVRTPGVPADARRLGDLRLECEVRSAIARAETNFIVRGALAAVTLGRGLCGSPSMHLGFFAGKNIREITLVSAGRREPLLTFSGPNYFPPLSDRNWPDDTLVEFQFEPAAAPQSLASPDTASN